jgi:SAM-dependent methyltransferase
MKYSRKTFLDSQAQKELIDHYLKERFKVSGKIPVTGRSLQNYATQLFPDIETNKVPSYVGAKDYLDVACGINHLYPQSLLRNLQGPKKNTKTGLDIHSLANANANATDNKVNYTKGSIYKTNFQSGSFDCITVNNFMYFWEQNPHKLLEVYKELYRLLRDDGEVRIFPVFFGNYSCDNIELFDFLNTHFVIQCLRPKTDYSKEAPVYLEKDELKQSSSGHGLNENRIYHKLMAHVVILRKL